MNSEELLQRAAEERHAIVQKYLKGREEGAEIDAWEEPFAIYHSLDRFGFVQDEKNHEQQALSQKALIEQKEKELEMERAKKWYKMFLSWKKVSPDKLKRRVYKGIPNACRGVAWALLLNVQDEIRDHPRKYEEMLDLAYKYSPDIRQIDLDVNRTYREHIFFRDRYGGKQKELFNVLAAYSVYNLEIGYCQGMSQIAALLLMYLSEQDAFWALSKLVIDPKYCMHGFFIPGFPKLLRYQEHHDKIMAKFLSKLKKHLDKNSVDTGIYTLKWFFQCFLDRIPFKLTLRVWDIYLLEGERIMSAMAYNLLKMHKNQLYKLNMDDILHFIQVKLEKQFEYSEDATIDSLQKCLEELRRNKLDYAGKPPAAELPKTKLGIFKPDAHSASLEQKVGRRTEFSSVEKSTQETVITRRDNAVAMATMLSDRNSSIGSKISFEPSLDDASSIANGGSRRSLADTSVTSTADISHVSAGHDSHSLGTGAGGSDVEVFVHSTGPSTPRAGTPRATTPKSPRHSSPRHSSRSPDDRIRIYVPYESPSHSPKPAAPKHQNSHDSDATIMNATNGSALNGHPASLPNSYSASYIPPRSPNRLKQLESQSHRSVSNPTSIYEQYETNKITIHIVDDNLATPLGERMPNSVSSPFHMEQTIDLK
uniref:USP6 N-terminal-like protein n=1 Tax=Cacopsylla melanoneura TaxID=428564 RepID=A0A8D9EN47_9HEMI